jgi:hypothetical protein
MSSINNPDLSNTKPEYWEAILKNHNLSMDRGLPRPVEGEIVYVGLLGLQTDVAETKDGEIVVVNVTEDDTD